MSTLVKASVRSWIAVSALTALIGVGRAKPEPVRASAPAELEYVSLVELARNPQEHLGRSFRVRFQVESAPESWNPYLTRFGSQDWRGLRAWADEQFLWEREAWENPAARVFARRGSIADEVLRDAPRLARFEALAHVRQVFLGEPWLEIELVQRLANSIGEGSVLHAERALEHLEKEQWRNALDNLDRALVGEMPELARAELRRLRELAESSLVKR